MRNGSTSSDHLHGGGTHGCGQYFCAEHLYFVETTDGLLQDVCSACRAEIAYSGRESDD